MEAVQVNDVETFIRVLSVLPNMGVENPSTTALTIKSPYEGWSPDERWPHQMRQVLERFKSIEHLGVGIGRDYHPNPFYGSLLISALLDNTQLRLHPLTLSLQTLNLRGLNLSGTKSQWASALPITNMKSLTIENCHRPEYLLQGLAILAKQIGPQQVCMREFTYYGEEWDGKEWDDGEEALEEFLTSFQGLRKLYIVRAVTLPKMAWFTQHGKTLQQALSDVWSPMHNRDRDPPEPENITYSDDDLRTLCRSCPLIRELGMPTLRLYAFRPFERGCANYLDPICQLHDLCSLRFTKKPVGCMGNNDLMSLILQHLATQIFTRATSFAEDQKRSCRLMAIGFPQWFLSSGESMVFIRGHNCAPSGSPTPQAVNVVSRTIKYIEPESDLLSYDLGYRGKYEQDEVDEH